MKEGEIYQFKIEFEEQDHKNLFTMKRLFILVSITLMLGALSAAGRSNEETNYVYTVPASEYLYFR